MPIDTPCQWALTVWWHKRPVGQNLWGPGKSAVDFEVNAPGVVEHRERERPSFQSFSGESRIFLFALVYHVDQRPHPKRPLLNFRDMTRKFVFLDRINA